MARLHVFLNYQNLIFMQKVKLKRLLCIAAPGDETTKYMQCLSDYPRQLSACMQTCVVLVIFIDAVDHFKFAICHIYIYMYTHIHLPHQKWSKRCTMRQLLRGDTTLVDRAIKIDVYISELSAYYFIAICFRATATLGAHLLFKDTTILQLCEEGAVTLIPLRPQLAMLHSDGIIFRDDFDSSDSFSSVLW